MVGIAVSIREAPKTHTGIQLVVSPKRGLEIEVSGIYAGIKHPVLALEQWALYLYSDSLRAYLQRTTLDTNLGAGAEYFLKDYPAVESVCKQTSSPQSKIAYLQFTDARADYIDAA
jgi:hypothetical protein